MSISVDNAIWIAGIVTETAVVCLLFYRRIWRTLPIFCVYCIWDTLSNLAAYIINRSYPGGYLYLHFYFVETAIDSVLEISVLVELTWSVLRPIRGSLPRGAPVVVGALILAAGAVIWPFAGLSGVHLYRHSLLLAHLEHTVSILRVFLFLLMAAGSQLLSIGWRDRELQVATGLGFYSMVSLAVSILHAHQSTGSQYVYSEQFVAIAYFCSLIYWVVSFSQKETERRAFTPEMQNFLLAISGAARSARMALADAQASKPPKFDGR